LEVKVCRLSLHTASDEQLDTSYRLVLNYKQIPYTTAWVEYSDIDAVSKQIGAPPTGKRSNGEPLYTVPILRIPGTDEVISDSANILRYLEGRYSEKPLVPAGTLDQQISLGNEIQGAVLYVRVPDIWITVRSVYDLYYRILSCQSCVRWANK
jgi:hypothetical protein